MKSAWILPQLCIFLCLPLAFLAQSSADIQDNHSSSYLSELKKELVKEWPNNRTINLVFHGHSVPAGYFKTPIVNTLEAYPYLLLKQLKQKYPTAVINIINTSIGGENAVKGETRFAKEVLTHRPDVLFIDYALNDIRQGLAPSKIAWVKMIEAALEAGTKVILLTPSPNLRFDILAEDHDLYKHTQQVRELAKSFKVGLVDSYRLFQQKAQEGVDIADFMSQGNHPNKQGHAVIAADLIEYFK